MVSIILVSLRSSLLWADWCEFCAATCAAEEAATKSAATPSAPQEVQPITATPTYNWCATRSATATTTRHKGIIT